MSEDRDNLALLLTDLNLLCNRIVEAGDLATLRKLSLDVQLILNRASRELTENKNGCLSR